MKIKRKTTFQISKKELEEILENELSQQGYEFSNLIFSYSIDPLGVEYERCSFFGCEIISECEE